MQWDGIPSDYQIADREGWEEAHLPLSDEFEQALRDFDGDAVNLIADLDWEIKDRWEYVTLVDYDTGSVTVVRPTYS